MELAECVEGEFSCLLFISELDDCVAVTVVDFGRLKQALRIR